MQTEPPVKQRRHNGRPARNQTQQSAATFFWTCLNSPLALWLLSSVILSSAVYAYQTWQDRKRQQEITGQQIERLTLEIAGRVSQFGTWTRNHLVYEQDGQKLEDLCHCDIGKDKGNFDTLPKERNDIQDLYVRTVQYKEAEVALLSPDYLLRYALSPDHDTFIRSFEGVFLTEDIRRSGLPSTDCLENLPHGGNCISYEEHSQPEASQLANPLVSANDRERN